MPVKPNIINTEFKYLPTKLKKQTTKIKIWKMMLIISSLLFLVFCIDRFTTVNLNFFAASSKNIPNLSQTLENCCYKIEKITNDSEGNVRYEPINDFYLVAESEKIIKLNGKGVKTFELDLKEVDSTTSWSRVMHYHRPSYFVMSQSGIYDLSKEKPELETFDTIMNQDGKMKWDEWINKFKNLYETSEQAIWAYNEYEAFPLYFKQYGKWKVLFYKVKNHNDSDIINPNSIYVKFKIGEDYVPDKFQKTYLLKDIQHGGVYSETIYFDNSGYPENNMKYEKVTTIETLSFKKEYSAVGNAVLIPAFLPNEFRGTAVNKLSIGNSDFIFKSRATKGAGFSNAPFMNYFYLFEVPTKFKKKNSLSFMYYKSNNSNPGRNPGIYVIKKRSE